MTTAAASDTQPLIRTDRLTRSFGSVTAIDQLTVEVPHGVVGLVGANGARKSTHIKVLLGLLEPTSGSAHVLGCDVRTEGMQIRAQVGYMPEHDSLPPDASASEFVVHMARMSGLPRAAARERAADVLRHVGLFEERYRPMGDYSTGMRQRAKLAQALVHDPRLVLLDEPTSGLDPAGRDDMLDLVARIHADFGISVLVTSHLLGELELVCDSVVVIDGGRLLRHSTTAELTSTIGRVTVEIDGDTDAFADALRVCGLDVTRSGAALDVALAGDHTYDTIRDAAVALGAGLVRLEQRRHRMSEVFS